MSDNNKQEIKDTPTNGSVPINGHPTTPLILQPSPQDQLLETIIEKGGEMMLEYTKMSIEKHRYTVDKQTEFDKEELKVIDKLDTKEKIYKGALISLCVVAFVLTAMYVPKSEIVIPVLSLIIGLLFKTNSLSDFFSHSRNRTNDIDTE